MTTEKDLLIQRLNMEEARPGRWELFVEDVDRYVFDWGLIFDRSAEERPWKQWDTRRTRK